GGSRFSPSIPFCRLASALIRLASTANPSPPTRRSLMQRRNTLSNTRRKRSLCRKRPCLFLENVEWACTAPPRPSRKKPPIGQIEVDLIAQAPLRSNAEAVADQEHPDHQLGIDRR